jgi:hypothetical protein
LDQIRQAAAVVARYSKEKDKAEAAVVWGPGPEELPNRLRVRPAREEMVVPLRF